MIPTLHDGSEHEGKLAVEHGTFFPVSGTEVGPVTARTVSLDFLVLLPRACYPQSHSGPGVLGPAPRSHVPFCVCSTGLPAGPPTEPSCQVLCLVFTETLGLLRRALVSLRIHEALGIQMVFYKCLIITIWFSRKLCHSTRKTDRRLLRRELDKQAASPLSPPLLLVFHKMEGATVCHQVGI